MINIYRYNNKYIIGCLITGKYPPNDPSNDNLLSSYMIPDGVHKITSDYFFFKMPVEVPIN